ncbi:uncharacterized protein Z518_05334 [Rhinocladiella mackenziei CBS 650.93]|uniref:Rhinocladiella mackenziei CBS 650.93 unplaced genomic scaffold supercont1.4, whole genome shotgun sequence n=1 Tax=Rhinocladiella mackenziei CBS 650.93 TaxID=1442369 RepID=A0A0D2IMW5_9EURO|nr:uncharacterized protein Z518_05334 [Rhinocladiella mackenziei CBS 650.93]KIX04466.1 hypothetical protein Z518_05334 [Rhinocladiella mackenziei CBS 650.93]
MPGQTPPTPKPSTTRSPTNGTKPRPRAGILRKTKAEREQFAKEEAERQRERAAEEAGNACTRGARTRAGRGGRDAAAGGQRDERARETPIGAGGVFGAGSGLKPGTKSKNALPEGYSEMLEGQQGGQLDDSSLRALAAENAAAAAEEGLGGSSSSGRAGTTKKQEIVDITSDDEPNEPKRDIERIWVSSDEDDDAIMSRKGRERATQRMPKPGMGLRPVRAPRIVKEEDAELDTSRKKARAFKKTDSEIQDLDEDDMDLDEPVFLKEQPSTSEIRRRSLKKQTDKFREVKFPTETIEERAERLRVTDDMLKLRDLFTRPHSRRGATVDDDQDSGKPNLEDGKMFLLQLPPLTPFLIDPTAMVEEREVKQEGTAEADTDLPPSAAHTGPAPPPDGQAKKDPDVPAPSKPALQLDGLLTASEPTRLPPGFVGKLRVHKSGKASLDWGGTDMEVRYGSEVDFLQDVVMVKSGLKREVENGDAGSGRPDYEEGKDDDDDDDDESLGRGREKVVGTSYALGQVRKKLVLVPDWTKLYD